MNDSDVDKDYDVLQAEADKIRADSKIAVRKAALWEDAERQLEEANRLWKNSSKA